MSPLAGLWLGMGVALAGFCVGAGFERIAEAITYAAMKWSEKKS